MCFATRFHGCLLIAEVSQRFSSSSHAALQKTESEFVEGKYVCLNIYSWFPRHVVLGNIPRLPFPSAS